MNILLLYKKLTSGQKCVLRAICTDIAFILMCFFLLPIFIAREIVFLGFLIAQLSPPPSARWPKGFDKNRLIMSVH